MFSEKCVVVRTAHTAVDRQSTCISLWLIKRSPKSDSSALTGERRIVPVMSKFWIWNCPHRSTGQNEMRREKKLKNYFLRAQRRFDGDFISRESPHHGHMIFYDRWKEIKFRHFRISTKRQLNCYSKVENAAFSCKHRRSFARKKQRRWRVAHIFFFIY